MTLLFCWSASFLQKMLIYFHFVVQHRTMSWGDCSGAGLRPLAQHGWPWQTTVHIRHDSWDSALCQHCTSWSGSWNDSTHKTTRIRLSQGNKSIVNKVKWNVAKYSDPYLEFALLLTCPSTHTHTHTPGAVGSYIVVAPKEQLKIRCLAQGSNLSDGIEGGREHCIFTPPRTCNLRVTSPTL